MKVDCQHERTVLDKCVHCGSYLEPEDFTTVPTEEGLYLLTNEKGGCYMRVVYYEDRQMGIAQHLVAEPALPYAWSSRPVFDLDDLGGEWAKMPNGTPAATYLQPTHEKAEAPKS